MGPLAIAALVLGVLVVVFAFVVGVIIYIRARSSIDSRPPLAGDAGAPGYKHHPDSVDYYRPGPLAPQKQPPTHDQSKKDPRKIPLPRCSGCGTAVAFGDEKCPKCGSAIPSEPEKVI